MIDVGGPDLFTGLGDEEKLVATNCWVAAEVLFWAMIVGKDVDEVVDAEMEVTVAGATVELPRVMFD